MITERLRNAIITRRGITLSIGIIFLCCAGGTIKFGQQYLVIRKSEILMDTTALREGFISLSDIKRITDTLQFVQRDRTADNTRQFEAAVDILFARYASFRRVMDRNVDVEEAAPALASLQRVAITADRVIENDYADPQGALIELTDDAETARVALVRYLDALQRRQNATFHEQSRHLLLMAMLLVGLLAVMFVIGTAALVLLRLELIERRSREAAEKKVDFLAYYDPLTQLANRMRLHTHLDEALAAAHPTTLVLLDVDDFKGINDSHGHAMGDAVLREIGGRFDRMIRRYDGMAGRLGGDEFAAVLPFTAEEPLKEFCSRFRATARQPIRSDGTTVSVTVSVGAAATTRVAGERGELNEAIFRAADLALYEAKAAGRDTFRIFDTSLARRHARRRDLRDAIPRALKAGDFFPVFQPKVLLDTGDLYGFEALIRWSRDGTIIGPDEFLPIAEESRQIVNLDLYMLEAATRQVYNWNTRYGLSLSVSVNLSSLHFRRPLIVEQVRRVLRLSGLAPELLTLEITETVLIEDWVKTTDILDHLKALGVSISLDDFGTGYSSLAYLRKLSADELKIDKSFVTGIEASDETRFVLDSIADIASTLGMNLVVEGIETQRQADIVRAFGCVAGQGYLFGKPVDATETEKILATGLRLAATPVDA